jgi:hypothetical protein
MVRDGNNTGDTRARGVRQRPATTRCKCVAGAGDAIRTAHAIPPRSASTEFSIVMLVAEEVPSGGEQRPKETGSSADNDPKTPSKSARQFLYHTCATRSAGHVASQACSLSSDALPVAMVLTLPLRAAVVSALIVARPQARYRSGLCRRGAAHWSSTSALSHASSRHSCPSK